MASKVTVAWRLAGHQFAVLSWGVISFVKERYLSLVKLRLCSGGTKELAGVGVDPSHQYRTLFQGKKRI